VGTPSVVADVALPTATLRFKIGSGGAVVSHTFNTTHTLADVHRVAAELAGSCGTSGNLLAGFPPKSIKNTTEITVGEAGLHGSVIRQRLLI
jgi:hypothetical protein